MHIDKELIMVFCALGYIYMALHADRRPEDEPMKRLANSEHFFESYLCLILIMT